MNFKIKSVIIVMIGLMSTCVRAGEAEQTLQPEHQIFKTFEQTKSNLLERSSLCLATAEHYLKDKAKKTKKDEDYEELRPLIKSSAAIAGAAYLEGYKNERAKDFLDASRNSVKNTWSWEQVSSWIPHCQDMGGSIYKKASAIHRKLIDYGEGIGLGRLKKEIEKDRINGGIK